jgi:formylglycine-generating enzyme required for sulfatase activity
MRTTTVLLMACAAAGLLSAQTPAAGAKKVNPKDGLTYVWVPAGKFQMGCSPGEADCDADEQPLHQVTLSKGFWLGQTAVTQEAYQRVAGKNPAKHPGPKFPVEWVDYDEATAYCKAIGGRLPTEAEWEYAARAGTTGASYGKLSDVAWYNDNSGGQSHEVGTKPPNAFGLYDMIGNTWARVSDWFGPYTAGAQTDPTGPASGTDRMPRGGSWGSNAKLTSAYHRDKVEQSHHGPKLGIRCAMAQ